MGKYIGARGLNYLWNKTKEGLDGKQNVVEDLADIRNGAAAGATAVQPGDNVSTLTNDAHYVTQSDMMENDVNANGHEYVDLHLPSGTLWATMNIGATAPEDYGNYYLYGYTTPNTGGTTPQNYNGVEEPLDLEHDAARVNWGGDWRMPTKAQMQELIANTTATTETVNGVAGVKFTAKDGSGNAIFLPYAGYKHNNVTENSNSCYWGATPSNNANAFALYLGNGVNGVSANPRGIEFPVRGILLSNITPKYATKEEMNTALNGKQNVVEDLADIRSGAAAGATAVQPGDNVSTLANDAHYVTQSDMMVGVIDANNHEYVDLGLPSGTLWATMNVGASAPEDYGNYYMYGYTTPYNSSDIPYEGTEDPLGLEHDAAHVNMGGDWHMPTKAQMEELLANTTCQWVTNYKGSGINGGTFTANNGAVLFLPAAGLWNDGSQVDVGNYGVYWGSSPKGDERAYLLDFFNGNEHVSDESREYGFSVRGVLPAGTPSPKYATKQELATGLSGKADKSEMSVTPGTGSNADKTTIQLKSGTSATVLTQHQDISGKQDVISDLADIRSGASLGATAVQTETDPTVPAWAKQQSKPSYSYSEIQNTPTNVSAFTNDVPYVTQSDMVVPNVNANGHEYVDLGLPSGTLWATMNVGASAPEGYGNYYMYGYTTPYDSSDTPYSGTEDPLSLEHDAARVNWGGDWKMPTKTQMEELLANTTYEWTTINGINGGKFTAKNGSGNYIFIPAASFYYNGSLDNVGDYGSVWSSSRNGSSNAYYLYFSDSSEYVDSSLRKYGCSVRGVLPPITMTPKYATKQELNTGLSGKAEKSEMSVTAGTGADADKTTIQLKTGTSATVLTQHQDISGKADKSEMSVTPGTGTDADKTTITLKTGTSATVLTAHQDISGKQDKVTPLGHTQKPVYINADGEFAACDNKCGATVVTLNNSWKGGTNASFYAPTNSGTSGQYLKSGGNNSAPVWENFPTNVSTFTNDAGYLTQHQDISGKVNSAVSVTYSQLVGLRTNSGLVAGQLYRITDFVTTVNSEEVEARSAGHQFDVIVRADSANTLNENAWAARHAGDTYFANSRLEAWQLKYMLDNEYWSDATNGKGIITWMKDEFDNECPYDFKNVQYKRYKVSDPKHREYVDNEYIAYSTSVDFDGIQTDSSDYKWMYTFSHKNDEILEAVDNSLNNVEGEYCLYNRIDGGELENALLSNNVLLSTIGNISNNICESNTTTFANDLFLYNSIKFLYESIIASSFISGNTINSSSGSCAENFIATREFSGNSILANQFFENVITGGNGIQGSVVNGNFIGNTFNGFCSVCEFLNIIGCTINAQEGYAIKFIDVDSKTITIPNGTTGCFVSTDSNDNLVIWNPADCPTKSEVAQTMVASQSVRNVVVLTQQEYDALAAKDNYTEYNIV